MQKMLSIRQMLVHERKYEHLIFYTDVKPEFKGILFSESEMLSCFFLLLLLLCQELLLNKVQELAARGFTLNFSFIPYYLCNREQVT